MKKLIITVLITGLSILAIKIGSIILKYSDDDYGAKQPTETQDSLLAEVEKEQITESLNANCRLRLNLSKDTLKFELKNNTESGEGYDAEFIYP